MLVNIDVKYLDWVAAVYLAQDKIGIEEIKAGFDLHDDNRVTFGLPSRLIAKVFLFRIIFGGSAYSFAKDPDFAEVKFSVKQWEGVIDKFYSKYKGIHAWHIEIVRTATTKGILTIPTGRSWKFEMKRDWKGELEWPITTMKNYPVQGLEADLMMIVRVSLHNRLKHIKEILIINSVHDSVLVDCPDKHVAFVTRTMLEVFEDVPKNFEKLFGVKFNLPFRGEIEIGKTWGTMEEI